MPSKAEVEIRKLKGIREGETQETEKSIAELADLIAANKILINENDKVLEDTSKKLGNTLKELKTAVSKRVPIGERIILPQESSPLLPTLAFGNGDTGFYEYQDNKIGISLNGILRYNINDGNFYNVPGYAAMRNVIATNTVPNIVPYADDGYTGIGRADWEELSLIAGGVECIRLIKNPSDPLVDLFGLVRVNSGQIKFPAVENPSANANTLDGYEEGSCTPGISFGGGNTGITYATQAGKYTKIGRQVTVTGYILLSSKGSSVGDAVITGLPFTIYNDNANYSAPNMRFANISFTGQYMGVGVVNNTTISLRQTTEAGIMTNLTDTNFANNSSIVFQFTYFVN